MQLFLKVGSRMVSWGWGIVGRLEDGSVTLLGVAGLGRACGNYMGVGHNDFGKWGKIMLIPEVDVIIFGA